MDTIHAVMTVVNQNQTAAVTMALLTYAFGFAQYITSMLMQVRDKEAPFFF